MQTSKYPQTKDWPSDESRIDDIGLKGATGDHYYLGSLTKGERFKVCRTGETYKFISKGTARSKAQNTKMKTVELSNQCLIDRL